MISYKNRWNLNRGYMNLDVWEKAMTLFKIVWETTHGDVKIDIKLRSQVIDSAQSVASNIAEGYSRRSINEYIRFTYIALSSLSETLTRVIGLMKTDQISDKQFNEIDKLHFEVENKLLKLIQSLEKKRDDSDWIDRIHDKLEEFNP